MVLPSGAGSKEVGRTQSQGQYISGRREEAGADLHPVPTGESQLQNREEGGRGGRVLPAKASACSTVRKRLHVVDVEGKLPKSLSSPSQNPAPVSLEGSGLLSVCSIGSAGSL